MAMPEQWQWIRTDDGAYLHYHFMSLASVTNDRGGPGAARFVVHIRWGNQMLVARAASIEQGTRHLERWWEARSWSPKPKPRKDSWELLARRSEALRAFWTTRPTAGPLTVQSSRAAVDVPDAWILGSDAPGRPSVFCSC